MGKEVGKAGQPQTGRDYPKIPPVANPGSQNDPQPPILVLNPNPKSPIPNPQSRSRPHPGAAASSRGIRVGLNSRDLEGINSRPSAGPAAWPRSRDPENPKGKGSGSAPAGARRARDSQFSRDSRFSQGSHKGWGSLDRDSVGFWGLPKYPGSQGHHPNPKLPIPNSPFPSQTPHTDPKFPEIPGRRGCPRPLPIPDLGRGRTDSDPPKIQDGGYDPDPHKSRDIFVGKREQVPVFGMGAGDRDPPNPGIFPSQGVTVTLHNSRNGGE